jgi:hypothetical protein
MQPAKTAGWSRLNVPIIVLMQLGGFPARRARNDVRKPRNFVNFTTQWQALAQAFSRAQVTHSTAIAGRVSSAARFAVT